MADAAALAVAKPAQLPSGDRDGSLTSPLERAFNDSRGMDFELRRQVGFFFRVSGVMVRDPFAAVERVRGRLDRRRDAAALEATGLSVDDLYPIDVEWQRGLHHALGCPWPCHCESAARSLYSEIMAGFAALGLPDRYQGWCDGSAEFTLAAWTLAIHLRPENVVETGVARGVTSRIVLEALKLNGSGNLSSVDLPAVDSTYRDQIAIAVPEPLRENWTLVSGTTRQRLPALLAELGEIDLFVHDSLHTGRNTRFEIEHAWNILRPGGALLVDDVYQSLVFHDFVATHSRWSVVAANPDGSYRFGVALKEENLASTLHDRASTVATDAAHRD